MVVNSILTICAIKQWRAQRSFKKNPLIPKRHVQFFSVFSTSISGKNATNCNSYDKKVRNCMAVFRKILLFILFVPYEYLINMSAIISYIRLKLKRQ